MNSLTVNTKFDSEGASLWLNVKMSGLVRMDYVWDLWTKKKEAGSPVLTKTSRKNSNGVLTDDVFLLINEFNLQESAAAFNERYIKLRMDILGEKGTPYDFELEILQGTTVGNAKALEKTVVASGKLEAQYLGYVCYINLKG